MVAARLEGDDVAEDEAARRVAEALCGPGAVQAAAFTGRANLYAAAAGLAVIDAARINAVNMVDEAITVATLPPGEMVSPRQMLATIKIMPFAVPRRIVERAVAAAGNAPAVALAPFRSLEAGLIITRQPTTKASVLAKAADAMAARMAALNGRIGATVTVDHDQTVLAEALQEMAATRPDLILVVGANAVIDRLDHIPAAITAIGGVVERFGMPVDPGNLLLTGELAGIPVIGVPGCARTLKLNGFDFILRRLAAGLPIDGAAIAAMGVGGLLKEVEIGGAARGAAAAVARAPHLAAIVLAAGRSSRMGGPNKLALNLGGKALVLHGVDAALEAGLDPVVVVTGHGAEQVGQVLAGRPVKLVHNPRFASGLSSSLRTGIEALDQGVDGAFVLLGDMPRVSGEHLRRLAAGFAPAESRAIVIPTAGGRWGNPILWARSFFPAMAELAGDQGARLLAVANPAWIVEIEMPDDGVLLDLDTAAEFTAAASA
ncbi:NTP transferase domain-containing protein [Oleomonas cavernae]|uniref:NTP transferase domain-containing protein n=1 Tax=Oleomonas cavernae TaxID=2320859 RepID=UPI001F367AEC|nr:NTP transferase domain-containing protein [Oleomonas cavernae]